MKVALWMLSAGVAVAASSVPLPTWTPEDKEAVKKGQLVPGLSLLTEESMADPLPKAVAEPPKPEEIAQSATPTPVVGDQYLDAYFGERPQHFLVDPQGLLSTKDARDRENFLNYHSSDSAIDLFVYLFDAHQEIPSEVREEEIVERHFSSGKPAVVVYYYLGAPERSNIYVSPLISDSVSAAEQRRALASSVEEAMEKPDKVAQFEAFCVQVAIRIYWMERATGLVTDEDPATPQLRPLAKAPKKEKEKSALVVKAEAIAAEWGPMAGIMGGALTIVGAGLSLARRRTRYRFPVFEVPPRMGGAHAAGIGAVISFGSTTQSPSSQRNEVPDYLGL